MTIYRRYRRVSTKEQARDSEAFTRQLWELEQQLAEFGIPLEQSPVYEDQQSGTEDDRPDFQRLLADLQVGDWLVITRIDRIARDVEFNAKLAKKFQRLRITLFEIQRGSPIDWNLPGDWEYFQRSGIDAEMESRKLSHRVRKGKKYSRFKQEANPQMPWGYQRVDKKYEIDPSVREYAERVIADLDAWRNYHEVVRRSKADPSRYGRTWTVEGLRRWFHNPALRGHTGYGEVYAVRSRQKAKDEPLGPVVSKRSIDGQVTLHEDIVWDTHPDQAILDDKRYQSICFKISRGKSTGPKSPEQRQPLSGLVKCGGCGGGMIHWSNKKQTSRTYWICFEAKQKLKPNHCTCTGCIRSEVVYEAVIEKLKQAAINIADGVIQAKEQEDSDLDNNPELLRLERMLAQLNAMPHHLSLETAKEEIRQQIIGLQRSQQQTASEFNKKSNERYKLFQLLSPSFVDDGYWNSLSNEECRDLFQNLIHRVIIHSTPREKMTRNPTEPKWDFEVEVQLLV